MSMRILKKIIIPILLVSTLMIFLMINYQSFLNDSSTYYNDLNSYLSTITECRQYFLYLKENKIMENIKVKIRNSDLYKNNDSEHSINYWVNFNIDDVYQKLTHLENSINKAQKLKPSFFYRNWYNNKRIIEDKLTMIVLDKNWIEVIYSFMLLE